MVTGIQWARLYVFIGPFVLLILAAIVAIILINQGTHSPGSPTNGNTFIVITAPTSTGTLADLIAQGDAVIASADFSGGLSYYLAYISQDPTDADVMFKIGAAYVDPKNTSPDYITGIDFLKRAINTNPSATWEGTASALIAQYQGRVNIEATATAGTAGRSLTGTGSYMVINTVTGKIISIAIQSQNP